MDTRWLLPNMASTCRYNTSTRAYDGQKIVQKINIKLVRCCLNVVHRLLYRFLCVQARQNGLAGCAQDQSALHQRSTRQNLFRSVPRCGVKRPNKRVSVASNPQMPARELRKVAQMITLASTRERVLLPYCQ
jgi:hypothetical protein